MEPIAIIGLASFFAQAHDLATYWDNIIRERDSITDVPPSRWDIADYYDPDPAAPDKTYCKRGGFLPDIDFDPLEFGLPPNILEVTDVSQLLALVAARQAFEDAGYGAERGFDFEHTGVILGICGGQKLMTPLISRLQYPIWERAMRSCGLSEEQVQQAIAKIKLAYIRWEENSFPGMLGNVIAGRIANRFDLGGINCVTDAACASSLSALQMALSELASHRCDMMLTGGVDTDNSPFMYMCFSKTPAFSRQEGPRPFDVSSDGMMVGEGLGMLVLKRLADAERDGDRVYAVIRGIGSSSDGRYKSIYAPRSEGQARALRRAYASADVPPASVGLIEAHGTGTVAGDLCEVQTLREVFGENNPRQGHIALGSVKSQIGHTKAAAGAAGLIKAALALHHQVLPPTINVDQPNPKFGLDGSPLYVNTRARPWLRAPDGAPRRAGVSAFGFGGTNFHVVLEEYAGGQDRPARLHQTAKELLIAASSPAELLARCESLAEALGGPHASLALAELAEATQTLVPPQAHARLGFVAADPTEAHAQIQRALAMLSGQPAAERLQHPKGIFYQRQGLATAGRVVALFPGQGSQYLEMGRELALNFPPLRDMFGQADAHAGALPLSEVLFPPPAFSAEEQAAQAARLQRTEYAQPAIGALSAGLFGLLRDAGFQPDFVAGHSFGELTALWAAGSIGDADFRTLMHARGQAMAPPADPSFDAGAMLAVSAELPAVQAIVDQVPGVTIANLNGYDQVVLAGPTAAIGQLRQLLEAAGHSATPLPVAAAFHTPLVGHAHGPFSRAVQACSFSPPLLPVYANATAQPYPADPQAIKAQLADQLLQPVYFLQQIEQLYAAGGAIFVEIGPRNVLTNLVGRILHDRPHIALALNPSRQHDSDRQLREAAVQLRVIGLPIRGIDPYQRPASAAPARQRKGPIVRLNGSNYVSEPTRAAFAAALATPPVASALPADTVIYKDSPLMTNFSEGLPALPYTNGVSPAAAANGAAAPSSASLIELMHQLQAHQHEILQVHQQFLAYQHEYVRLLLQLTQGGAGQPEGGLNSMYQLQAETLRIHQQFLAQQGDYASRLLQLIHKQLAPVAGGAPIFDLPVISQHLAPLPPAPATVFTPPPAPAATLPVAPAPSSLPIAPPPMPLVNSAPPASIFALPTAPPPAPAASAAPIIVPPMPSAPFAVVPPAAPIDGRDDRTPTLTPATSVPPAPSAQSAVVPAAQTADALVAQLSEGLLAVVSDKTGYPRETLELAMDMEADLGIDSIKRVDILGTMQARFALPPLAPEELAELRTLGQVVAHLQRAAAPALNGHYLPVALATSAAVAPAPPMALPAPSVQSAVVPTSQSTQTADALVVQLSEGLLAVVSDKTGYPRETLELAMDMEADLGIDSIKRVDILGTMQARFALPPLAPEELAELRTLGQVVGHLQRAATPTAAPQNGHLPADMPSAQTAVAPPATSAVAYAPVSMLPLPAPDQLEIVVPDGWSCVITDDGSATAGILAQSLAERGWQPVVLRLPSALLAARPALPRGVGRVVLQDMSEGQLDQALRTIAESYGPIGGFIHLHPQPAALAPAGGLLNDSEQQIVRQVFLAARQLSGPLNQAARSARALFVTVTRLDGALGTAMSRPISPLGGGLFGLVKTLHQEWAGVFCRAIDLSPDYSAEQAAQLIMAELADPDLRLAEVGYSAQGRVTLAAELVAGSVA